MPKQEDVTDVEEWKNRIQQDITDLKNDNRQIKNEQSAIKGDITKLQMSDQLQTQEINTLKETFGEIKDDLKWIKRKITGAIISAVIVAVVGGVIGIAISTIYGG